MTTPFDEGTAYGLAPAIHDRALTEVGAGTPMGELLRRYWHPVGLAKDANAEPHPVRVLGEDLILFRDGESVRLLAYKYDVLAKSSMDGVNWMDSTLARGAMFDPGTDAVPITVEEARKLHPNLVLPE